MEFLKNSEYGSEMALEFFNLSSIIPPPSVPLTKFRPEKLVNNKESPVSFFNFFGRNVSGADGRGVLQNAKFKIGNL